MFSESLAFRIFYCSKVYRSFEGFREIAISERSIVCLQQYLDPDIPKTFVCNQRRRNNRVRCLGMWNRSSNNGVLFDVVSFAKSLFRKVFLVFLGLSDVFAGSMVDPVAIDDG